MDIAPTRDRSMVWKTHRLRDHPMIKACCGQPAPYTPIWFMRQAGSYIPEHAKLMDQYGLLTLTKTPELCTRVTLLPLQVLNVDAAVMFADIILPLAGMGIEFHYDARGPVIENPVRDAAAVAALRIADPQATVPFILQAVSMVQRELSGRAPLIGFSGGPFTLAAYMIEGRPSDTFPITKAFMYKQPQAWAQLMEKLTTSIIAYLQAQVEAGIDVVQLFDSWIGVLQPADFRRFVLPYTRRIMDALAPSGLPRIHFGVNTAGMMDLLPHTGADVISMDWRVDIDRAWETIGTDRSIQGNLDPAVLLADPDTITDQAGSVLKAAGGRPGHIFNLGHRVPLNTPVDHLARLVDHVHEQTAQ